MWLMADQLLSVRPEDDRRLPQGRRPGHTLIDVAPRLNEPPEAPRARHLLRWWSCSPTSGGRRLRPHWVKRSRSSEDTPGRRNKSHPHTGAPNKEERREG